ncbi:hypothetical protein [Burkholderia sp. BCC0419]|uniref:hypothetical protein n=1 Tax=Burkholderia sp. BCC0419 TaxID=486878 RepID=UPI0015888683|nr:hypothetical protein [Burkholderia sp. BCC0419]
MTALVKSPLRRLDAHVGCLFQARSRDAAGFDSRPFEARAACNVCRRRHRGFPGRLFGSPACVPRSPLERRTPRGTHSLRYAFEEHTMARIGAFCITTWLAAAILYFGQHSVAMIVLSGVVVFGGFDLLRP